MEWDVRTGLTVRLKSLAGAVISTWRPDAAPMQVLPDYDPEYEERTTAAKEEYPTSAGFRAHLTLVLLVLDGHVAGSGTTSSLETVLAGLGENFGSYLEIALHTNAGIPTFDPDYKRVNWTNGWHPKPLHDTEIGFTVTLEFDAAVPQTTFPALDNGSAW